MKDSKWFTNSSLEEVLVELGYNDTEKGTVVLPAYYEEVFNDVVKESRKLSDDKHKTNLQILALSSIVEIQQLATDELHKNDWLTADEQMEAVNHFVEVGAPKMLSEIQEMLHN